MNTIDNFFHNSCKANPNKLALVDDNSKFSYSELESEVKKFSSF